MRMFHDSAFNPMLDPEYLFHYAAALEHNGEHTEAEEFYEFASTLGEIHALPIAACKTTKHYVTRKPFDQFVQDDDGA